MICFFLQIRIINCGNWPGTRIPKSLLENPGFCFLKFPALRFSYQFKIRFVLGKEGVFSQAMSREIQIVSFGVPYPPDYGGAIDVYYKIRSLAETGCRVILHCFEYEGNHRHPHLESLCTRVHYYKRRSLTSAFDPVTPHIVESRQVKQLLGNLVSGEGSILFDGVHTTGFINHPALQGRNKAVRAHNVESQYYTALARTSSNVIHRSYYRLEAIRLKKWEESKLSAANVILPISKADTAYFNRFYPGKVSWLPPFHKFRDVSIKEGKGDFVLVHGDYSIGENVRSTLAMIRHVFGKSGVRVIIAGRNPKHVLVQEVSQYPNIALHPNVSEEEMEQLMRNAQVQVIHAEQTAGFKLKLLHAAFSARHCLCNTLLSETSGLAPVLQAYADFDMMATMLPTLMEKEITGADIEKRREVLFPTFDNTANAQHIMALVG